MPLLKKNLLDLATCNRNGGAMRVNAAGNYEVMPLNTPRISYDPLTLAPLGLTFNRTSTNLIKSSMGSGSMVGVVCGSTTGDVLGTWPLMTGGGNNGNGLKISVVGSGVENGLPYVDYQFKGKSTNAYTETYLFFGTTPTAGMIAGTKLVQSAFIKIVGGNLTNIKYAFQRLQSDLTLPAKNSVDLRSLIPTSGPLAAARFEFAAPIFDTASLQCMIFVLGHDATDIDVTFRVAVPQLEVGTKATAPILTNGSVVLTNQDTIVIEGDKFSSWFTNQNEWTAVVDFVLDDAAPPMFPSLFALRQGRGGSTYSAELYVNSGRLNALMRDGVDASNITVNKFVSSFSIAAGTRYRASLSYSATKGAIFAVNGAVVFSTTTPFTLPTFTSMRIGTNTDSVGCLEGFIKNLNVTLRAFSQDEHKLVTAI